MYIYTYDGMTFSVVSLFVESPEMVEEGHIKNDPGKTPTEHVHDLGASV